MLLDVNLDLTPVPVVIANLLAPGANRQQAAQRLDLGQSILQLGDQHFALSLRLLSLGNVAEVCREYRLALLGDGRDTELDGEFGAVRAHCCEFDAFEENRSFRSVEITLQPLPVPFAQGAWNNSFGQIPAQDAVARVTECPLCGRVELGNLAGVVYADDTVQRRLHNGSKESFPLAQLCLGALAFCDVSRYTLNSDGLPVLVDKPAADFQNHGAAVFGGDLDFISSDFLSGELSLQHLLHQGELIRLHDLAQAVLEDVIPIVTGNSFTRFIEGSQVALQVQGVDNVVGIFNQVAVALLARAQFFLEAAARFAQALFFQGRPDHQRQSSHAVFQDIIRGAFLDEFDREVLSYCADVEYERNLFVQLSSSQEGDHTGPPPKTVIAEDKSESFVGQLFDEFTGSLHDIGYDLEAGSFQVSHVQVGIGQVVLDYEDSQEPVRYTRGLHL